jgi:hypothetical protein
MVEYMSLFQRGAKTRKARKNILNEQRDQLKVRITEMSVNGAGTGTQNTQEERRPTP